VPVRCGFCRAETGTRNLPDGREPSAAGPDIRRTIRSGRCLRAEQVCFMRFAPIGCAQSAGPSSWRGATGWLAPPSRKNALRLRRNGRIAQKFHRFGWTAPISPTYCPHERIFTANGKARGRAFGSIKAAASTVPSVALPFLHRIGLSFPAGGLALDFHRGRRSGKGVSLWCAQGGGPVGRARKPAMPHVDRRRGAAARCRWSPGAVRSGCRPSGESRCRARFGFRPQDRHAAPGNGGRAGASGVDTRLTAAPPCRSCAAFPDAGLPDERSSEV